MTKSKVGHLTTYCRQMGHSAICLPHWVQVHMCPHSNITQSIWSMDRRVRLGSKK